MIKLQIIGDIGKDAISQIINQKNYAKFSVAVKSGEKTQWVDCLKLDTESKLMPHLKSGKRVFCEGMPTVNAYIKEDKAIASMGMFINELHFLDKLGTQAKPTQSQAPEKDYDDLPFD